MAYLAAMATLLKWQNPMHMDCSAWCPGGLKKDETINKLLDMERDCIVFSYKALMMPYLTRAIPLATFPVTTASVSSTTHPAAMRAAVYVCCMCVGGGG